MKIAHAQCVLSFFGIILFCAPLFAQIAPTDQGNTAYDSRSLVPSTSVQKWTQNDINAICGARWGTGSNSYNSCIQRNQGKIGREETSGEIQELETLKHVDNAPKK